MSKTNMPSKYILTFLVSFFGFSFQLAAIRYLDVLFLPSISYYLLTVAMIAFSIAAYFAFTPSNQIMGKNANISVGVLGTFIVMSCIAFPLLSLLPSPEKNHLNSLYFFSTLLISFSIISIPIFISGLILSKIFINSHSKQALVYSLDMAGIATAGLTSTFFFNTLSPNKASSIAALILILYLPTQIQIKKYAFNVLCIIIIVGCSYFISDDIPKSFVPKYFPTSVKSNSIVKTIWSESGRTDIVKTNFTNNATSPLHVFYNGGIIGTHIFPFDGDFETLKNNYLINPNQHFTRLGTVAAHYLKQGTNPITFIMGVGGGHELKAALMFGARKVVANELSKTILDLGMHTYKDFNGGIFLDPRVTIAPGDGRYVLERQSQVFDIIQIFSNYLGSSFEKGVGVLDATYIFTVEAFQVYFDRLNKNGILQINQFNYPKILNTAAAAWQTRGGINFKNHIVVMANQDSNDFLPTLLIKMSPWSNVELKKIQTLFDSHPKKKFYLAEDPLDQEKYFKYQASYHDIKNRHKFNNNSAPITDNAPFFFKAPLRGIFLNNPFVIFKNVSLLFCLAFLLLCAILVIFFRKKQIAQTPGQTNSNDIAFFITIGAGFIFIEYSLIYLYMQAIELPQINLVTTVSSLFLGTSIGSYIYHRLSNMNISPKILIATGYVFLSALFLMAILSPVNIDFINLFNRIYTRTILCGLYTGALAIPLGLFFPMGSKVFYTNKREQMRFAWVWNGLGFALGGALSTILLPELGIYSCLLAGVILYIYAALKLKKQFLSLIAS